MMTDDEMAGLLGDSPPAADPAFRFDVFARVTARAQRRAALQRGVLQAAVLTSAGAAIAAIQAAGFPWPEALPVMGAAAVVVVSYALAIAVIQGPRALLGYTRTALRVRV
jgi:hypothetical protein